MGTTTRRKEERQMGSDVWEGKVLQEVLEKIGMKKKTVKFRAKSAERGGVEESRMKLRSAEIGGCRIGE
jgi:hypothetical protein